MVLFVDFEPFHPIDFIPFGNEFNKNVNSPWLSQYDDPWLQPIEQKLSEVVTLPSPPKFKIGQYDELFPKVTELQKTKNEMWIMQQRMQCVPPIRTTFIDPSFLSGVGLSIHIMHVSLAYFQLDDQYCGWKRSEVALFLDKDGHQVRYPQYWPDFSEKGGIGFVEFLMKSVIPIMNKAKKVENGEMEGLPTSQNPLDIIRLDEFTLSHMLKFLIGEEQQMRKVWLANKAEQGIFWESMNKPPKNKVYHPNALIVKKNPVKKERRTMKYKDERTGNFHWTIVWMTGDQDGVATTIVTSGEGKLKEMQFSVVTGGQIVQQGSVDVGQQNNLMLGTVIDEKNKGKEEVATGYKVAKTADGDDCLIRMEIPENAKMAFEFKGLDKMRTNKAKIISIWTYEYVGNWESDIENNTEGNIRYLKCVDQAYSCVYQGGKRILYQAGEELEDPTFDCSDLESVCMPGIHFCWLRANALEYHGIYNVIESNIPDEPSGDNNND